MKKNNRGFTLVELLAVIAILGIVVSITIFVGINAVNKAKEKSYNTTKNNIENIAGTYLKENGDRLFYISKNDGTVNNLVNHKKDLIINLNGILQLARKNYSQDQLNRIRLAKTLE